MKDRLEKQQNEQEEAMRLQRKPKVLNKREKLKLVLSCFKIMLKFFSIRYGQLVFDNTILK